jgi:hypothetical protein
LANLRWNYRIKSQLEESKEEAIKQGFDAFWLFGTSKTGNEYPLNQLKIKGGALSSKIKIHVSSNATQLYYYVKGSITFDDLSIILLEKENAEKILNEIIVFAPDESKRFEIETAKPVESLAMLKMEKRLHELLDQALDAYGNAAIEQGMNSLLTGIRGNLPLASTQIRDLIDELASFGRKLIEEARKSGDPYASQFERDFNETLTAPMDKLLLKQKKIDLNPKLGDFKE